jgi:hypothetical protein
VSSSSGGLDAATVEAEVDRILEEVATARNLGVTADVKVEVADRPRIRAFAEKTLYEHTTKEAFALQGRIEGALGVIPVDADPQALLLGMLEEGILGYYDPKAKTLFIGDFVPQFMLSQVVGHEIAHGLQDMHFDLARHQSPIDHRSDAETARTFLIEGDAQAAYYAWISGEGGLASVDDELLDAMTLQTLDMATDAADHPVLARMLQLPYTAGAATVVRLVLAKGWTAVDKLYADPPQTSEQMLHIDKLLAREPAMPVHLSAEALETATGMRAIWFDELGEAALMAMLAEIEPSTDARRDAAGWGGGQFVALADPNEPESTPTILGAVTWDTESDAAEFEASFREYLREVTPQGTFIGRRRDAVVFATHVPARIAANDLKSATWKALSRKKGAH